MAGAACQVGTYASSRFIHQRRDRRGLAYFFLRPCACPDHLMRIKLPSRRGSRFDRPCPVHRRNEPERISRHGRIFHWTHWRGISSRRVVTVPGHAFQTFSISMHNAAVACIAPARIEVFGNLESTPFDALRTLNGVRLIGYRVAAISMKVINLVSCQQRVRRGSADHSVSRKLATPEIVIVG